MSGTARLIRHYLERAIIEAGAGVTLRDPDVRAALEALEAGLDRQDDAIAEALAMTRRSADRVDGLTAGQIAAIGKALVQRLEAINTTLDRILAGWTPPS